MTKTKFSDRSIKSFLLWKFLPLLVSSVVAVTAWSIAGAWFGALRSAEQWTSSYTAHFQSEINEIRQEALLAKDSVMLSIEHNEIPNLPEGYVILKLEPNNELVPVFGGADSPQVTAKGEDELKQINRLGLYEIEGNFEFAVPMQAQSKDGPNQKFILLRRLDHRFADRISSAMGTEVALYVLRPEPKIAASSWKNENGDRVIPEVPSETWRMLAKLADAEIRTGHDHYHIPDYQGLYGNVDGVESFHKGATDFGAYHAFRPILDENQKRIGYFSVILPEDVLLTGAKDAVWALGATALFVIILGTWLLHEAAVRFAKPLTEYTEEINDIVRTLYAKSAKYGGDVLKPQPGKARNEFESLATSISLLKAQLIRAERIENVIEDERSRGQFASKMAALGEMSASVAHEINNPVAIIHALSDELQEKAAHGNITKDEVSRMAQVIKETATRVASIIRALLRLSRDANEDPKQWHSLQSLIDDATILIQDQIAKEHITFSVRGLTENQRLLCRGTQISQVILNLLNNAIDAVEDSAEKKIEIQIATNGTAIEIAAVDSGAGISDEVRNRIMEPFVTTKPPGKGTGLGLSISKHIVEEHGGKLFVDDSSHETQFVIELPVGPETAPITSLEQAASVRKST